MIHYLVYEYRSKVKPKETKKISEIPKKDLIVLVVVIIWGIVSVLATFFDNNIFMFNIIAYAIFIFFIYKLADKNYENNIKEKVSRYHEELKAMRKILRSKEYKLYNEAKIRTMIIKIEKDTVQEKKYFNKELMTLLIIPIILQWTSSFITGVNSIDAINNLISLCMTIGVIYGSWIIIKPLVDQIKNAKNNDLIKLKRLLEDILLLDFIK